MRELNPKIKMGIYGNGVARIFSSGGGGGHWGAWIFVGGTNFF